LGVYNTPLERYFEDLSSGMVKTPKFLIFQLINKKNEYASV
jgi:hypothetical protein